MVKTSHFNSKMKGPNCQSSTSLKFMWPKHIRKAAIEIFIEKVQGSYVTVMGK